MKTIDSVERFLEVQVKEWNRHSNDPGSGQPGPVITITRDSGCHGEAIAKTLADALGLVLYDWKLVEEIAKDAHVNERVVATLDENIVAELDDWLEALVPGPNFSSFQYMQSLRKVLFTVASHGSAIIVGRGANFMLPPEKRTLRLRLVASLAVRSKNIMHKSKLTENDALKQIAQNDADQRLWVKKHVDADLTDASHYDLVINTGLVTPETIVQIVKELLKDAKTDKINIH